jgi:trichohyalin
VSIIEVKAVGVTPDCRDMNNQANQHYWGDCGVCRRKDQERQEQEKAYRIIWEREERTRVEVEYLEREKSRVQNAARKAEQERTREVYRIEQERAREVDRIEQERVREAIRARKREEHETERKRERDLAEIKREHDLAERKRERDLAEIKRERESKQETVARQLFVNSIGATVPQARINNEERVHRQFNANWFK